MNSYRPESVEICRILEVFRESLVQQALCTDIFSTEDSICSKAGRGSNVLTREELIEKIEALIISTVKSIARREPPSLSFGNTRSWDNISFKDGSGLHLVPKTLTSVRFSSTKSINKYALTIKILSVIHKLLLEDTYCTKRELYYQDVQLYGNQSVVNDIVDLISCMLKVPRWQLHVLATSKGCIAGQLQFRDYEGNLIDCSKTDTGILISNHVTAITNMSTQAKCILLIEKDATFQKLLDESFYERHLQCILITGKGFPDVNTRLMVHKLWDTFHLPIFALVDADPHGIEIMTIYKYGSRALSFETINLTVPSIRWLGVLPSDVYKLQIREEYLIKLSNSDIQKAKELLSRDYIAENGPVRNEIELILKHGMKAEIQCLSHIGSSFLTDIYIPNKILSQAWV